MTPKSEFFLLNLHYHKELKNSLNFDLLANVFLSFKLMLEASYVSKDHLRINRRN